MLMRSLIGSMRILSACLALFAGAQGAFAGAISTPSLASIFSQSSFGSTPITVNWLSPGTTIINPALATIDNGTELNQLFAMRQDSNVLLSHGSKIINVFFVDALNFCGNFNTSIVGCAPIPGNVFVVESSFAASSSLGANLIAHELSHTLGLDHVTTAGNLMNGTLSSTSRNLTTAQVATILGNFGGTLQTATNGSRFLELRPISVLSAAVVPEPEAWIMLAGGLLLVTQMARRRRVRGA